MKTIYLNSEKPNIEPCVATIGFFDGVHRGHQYLIKHVVDEAQRMQLKSAIITFDIHPRQALQSDYVPELLCTNESKILLLSRTGVDYCIILHFDTDMASLPADRFMQQILKEQLGVQKLILGYDNRFGHNREFGFDDYVRFGKEIGMQVEQHQALTVGGLNVSSSVIRQFIREGQIEKANQYLGYPYTICGTVTGGRHEGRKLGFPTANFDLKSLQQLLPAAGVYAVLARNFKEMATRHAMMNIGTRPTFNGKDLSVETHILDFDEDLYDQTLLISFVHRIREEQHFETPEELAEQLKRDAQLVKEQFEKDNENE